MNSKCDGIILPIDRVYLIELETHRTNDVAR